MTHGYDRHNWSRLHRELGKINLHMQNEGRVDGTWSAPLYTLIWSKGSCYRQRVGGTTGDSMAQALARGLSTLNNPLWTGEIGVGVRLALLALLMEDATCARS